MTLVCAPTFSPYVTRYLTIRAIDPALAWELGVREDHGDVIWPTVDADRQPSPRRRRRDDRRPGPKCRGAKGRTLGVWWPRGLPNTLTFNDDVLICEGESDAMAAVTALRDVSHVKVASLPGASFPERVLIDELCSLDARCVALAMDHDDAGGLADNRLSTALVEVGIGVRLLYIPHGEDLASTLAQKDDRQGWLERALIDARPVGMREAALIAENYWLRTQLRQHVETRRS